MKDEVKMIPIDQIRILNPRHRDRKKFEIIVQSIKNLGLKKPIQVSLRSKNEEGGLGYDLVCGQGRIEAFIALGYTEIPAEVVEVSKEDRLLRSLIENLARRFPATMDLIREIERLKAQGYSHAEIGDKLDFGKSTIKGLLALKNAGEDRLVEAAIVGRVPVTVAIEIARAKTVEAQRALLKAYENKQLNYVSIRAVKRLIDQRRFFGRKFNQVGRNPRKTTAENLVKILKRENERQKLLIRKAKVCEAKLIFIVTAFDKLLADKNFMPLLQAESLDTMPKHLWSKLIEKHKEAA
jgi:ParB family transcriptional regulator, chromosome partitioning protein